MYRLSDPNVKLFEKDKYSFVSRFSSTKNLPPPIWTRFISNIWIRSIINVNVKGWNLLNISHERIVPVKWAVFFGSSIRYPRRVWDRQTTRPIALSSRETLISINQYFEVWRAIYRKSEKWNSFRVVPSQDIVGLFTFFISNSEGASILFR